MSSWWDSRAFYHPERVAEEKIDAIEKCYNLNHIDKDIEYTIEFLQHLEKAQKACQKLLSVAYYHRGHVEETTFRYQVYYKRSDTLGVERLIIILVFMLFPVSKMERNTKRLLKIDGGQVRKGILPRKKP
jgi:hypothetical protein